MNEFLYCPTEKEIIVWYYRIQQYKYGFQDKYYIPDFIEDIRNGAVHKTSFGIFYLTRIQDTFYNAYGHCIFWDRRTKRRGRYLRALLNKALKFFHLERITVVIPAANRATAKWLSDNGFWIEGIMRGLLLFHGELYDAYILAYYSERIRAQLEPKLIRVSYPATP